MPELYLNQRFNFDERANNLIVSAPSLNLAALKAFDFGIQIAANNLANIQTNGFKAGEAVFPEPPFQSGPYGPSEPRSGSGGPYKPYQGPSEASGGPAPESFVEASATEVAREIINLIIIQRAYQANTKPITTQDDMLGFLINLKT